MAIYAIGDVQGCYDELQRLLEKLRFDSASDSLWFAGDLVNRGPSSLQVLRLVKAMGDKAVVVLGNHDLHLLAVAAEHSHLRPQDTLGDILNAPDRDELLDWLQRRPLLHYDDRLDVALVHAGLPPQWDLATARRLAADVEAAIRGTHAEDFFAHMYGDQPHVWADSLEGVCRWRFITNCLTRLRFCDAQGRLALKPKGPPGCQPKGFMPWFQVPGRKSAGETILFGHWAALGAACHDGVYSLDSGCAWGGSLTALQVDAEKDRWFHHSCAGARIPPNVQ